MSSEKKSSNQNNITKADMKKAIRAAPNVVKPNHIGEYVVSNVPGLGSCLTLVIVPSAGHASQLVIHRPIGVHKLDGDRDWVMSTSNDIDLLLARSKDPDETKIRAVQQANRSRLLVEKKLVVERDGKYYYDEHDSITRSEHLATADKLFATAVKEKKTNSKTRRVEFLPDPVRPHEFAIMEFLKTPDAISEIEKGAVRTFQTRGGVLDDVEQQAIKGLHGKSLAEVYAVLPKLMIEGIGRGERVNVTTNTIVAKEQSVDTTALRQQIYIEMSKEFADAVDHLHMKIDSTTVLVGECFKHINESPPPSDVEEAVRWFRDRLTDISNMLEKGPLEEHDH